ncbi:hypothetical protein ACVNS2_33135 [Paenibacillus caseinilyticus]|uniref:hypothetical protein n=1 Tax=Paenibacillus mucilaginosus TaxID=61624 RepID=UPI000FFEE3B5
MRQEERPKETAAEQSLCWSSCGGTVERRFRVIREIAELRFVMFFTHRAVLRIEELRFVICGNEALFGEQGANKISYRASIDSGHPLREFEIMDLNEEVFTWVNSGRDTMKSSSNGR